MIQREREAEGDEFADKEQFVTQAYKDQMAEVRKAEEEEKKREGMSCLVSHSSCECLWLLSRGREGEAETVDRNEPLLSPASGATGSRP